MSSTATTTQQQSRAGGNQGLVNSGLGAIGSGGAEIKRGRRIENLARTGIEYPMMKELGHAPFISAEREREPLVEVPAAPFVVDEYI
jgi:hypothetical protein